MAEVLIIENFGPIKKIDLKLKKINVFIGEQSTGKSTIAKIISICRYFSYLNDYNYLGSIQDPFAKGLKDWGIYSYYNSETKIYYENDDYKIEVFHGVRETDNDENGNQVILHQDCSSIVKPISERYKNLLEELEQIKPWYEVKKKADKKSISKYFNDAWLNWEPNENFYRLNVKKVMENPFYFPTERGLQSIFSLGKSHLITESLYEQLSKLNFISRNFTKSTEIAPLGIKYVYKDGLGYTKRKNDTEFRTLHNGASGFQSVVPIVLTLKYYAENEKRKNRTIVIEEPEINLFPSKQHDLVKYLVQVSKEFNYQFILPTHSPYILSTINNLLMAFKKKQKGVTLNPDDCAVYQLKNGTSFLIMDKKLGLIDENIIDEASEDINDDFNELLDIK